MSEPARSPLLSLVIPAYDEEARLPATLDELHAYLGKQPYAAEVLVVDDGSTDGTRGLVEARATGWPALRLIATPHLGKGHAVKVGLLAAAGEFVCICDADFSMPVVELGKLLGEARGGCDVAIASREAPGACRYGEPLYRHVMGRVFNALVRWTVLPGIQDSQCGFKCLRGELARRLAEVQTIDGWGFDVELLCVARLWGRRVEEVPIDWYYAASSRIHPLRDTWEMTREVLRVWRNLRRGAYPATLTPGPSPARGRGEAEAADEGGEASPSAPPSRGEGSESVQGNGRNGRTPGSAPAGRGEARIHANGTRVRVRRPVARRGRR